MTQFTVQAFAHESDAERPTAEGEGRTLEKALKHMSPKTRDEDLTRTVLEERRELNIDEATLFDSGRDAAWSVETDSVDWTILLDLTRNQQR